MKKIILTLATALLVGAAFTSCNKGENAASGDNAALGDSIADALGCFAGAQSAMGFQQMSLSGDSARMAKMKKEDYLRGLKTILDADTNSLAYYEGIQMGLQLVNPILGMNNDAGIPVNKDKVYEAFKTVFMQDSVQDMSVYYTKYQEVMQKAQEIMKAKQEKAIAESPAAKDNLKAGQEYQAKMLKEGYKKSSTGLIYKIENPGTGAPATDADNVTLSYVGTLVNGQEFDKNDNATFSPAQVVPGFAEALKLVGKGGKIIAVIPADLAYGLNAPQQIGPNQTLVFTIEIKDIHTAAQAAAAAQIKAGAPQVK